MANIDDVAKKCGVSIATVSRVFNRRGNVRPETVDKVIKAADALDYNPKLTARRDSIALVLENLDYETFGGYNALMLAALSRNVVESGYRLEIVRSHELGVLRDNFVCGVISMLYSDRFLERLEQARRLPVVTVNAIVPGMPAVVSNDLQGIGLAMKHLVDLGHRRIGLRSGGKRTFSAASREAAFKYWTKELGLKTSECSLGAGRGNQTEYLAKMLLKNPTAVIACGEAEGVSAAYSLRLLNRHIPEDLSFITFEYPGVSNVFPPSHTTIAQDVEQLAEQAMNMVHAMESGDLARDDEKRLEVDYKLIVRDSTAPPPAAE